LVVKYFEKLKEQMAMGKSSRGSKYRMQQPHLGMLESREAVMLPEPTSLHPRGAALPRGSELTTQGGVETKRRHIMVCAGTSKVPGPDGSEYYRLVMKTPSQHSWLALGFEGATSGCC
jgi:hypothetical protein